MDDLWPEYAAAAVPVLFEAWGKPLYPLSLGHLSALRTLGHPLIYPGRAWTRDDVGWAIFLGRFPGHKAMGALSSSRTQRAVFWFSARNRRRSMVEGEAALRRWYTHYFRAPKMFPAEKSEVRAPLEWMLLARLAGGVFPAQDRLPELWDTPLNVAFAWLCANKAVAGDDSVMSEEDVAAAALAKERLAALSRESGSDSVGDS